MVLSTLSTKELVKEFNARSTKAITGWKGSKAALIKKIETLAPKVGNGAAGPAKTAAEVKPATEVKKTEKPVKTTKVAEPKKPRVTIAIRVLQLMQEGKDYAKILKVIHTEYPKAKTTENSLEWYTWKYNRDGLI